MRLLILSFSYAPRANPRATRWTTLAEEFARSGHSVLVITSWQQGLPEQETVNGVQIYRVGMQFLEHLRRKISANQPKGTDKAVAGSTGPAEATAQAGIFLRLLKMLNQGLWRKLWWPDSTCIWLRPALNTARRLLAEQPADVIISVSPTFSAVVAGHLLAHNRQRCRRWIIDLGDPFSFMEQAAPNNIWLYGGLNRWFEKRAFLRADGISVTTAGTREMYARLYPECAGKITVIPPLLSPSPEPMASGPFFPNPAATRLVFIGTLYRHLRRPDYLLQLFSAMLQARPEFNAELHLIGDTHECRESLASYQQRLGTRLVIHGPVDRSMAAQAMTEADILVNLGNETAYQLPSKLVEYAATGKRIVNISSLASDSSTDFLKSYPVALCLQDQGAVPSAGQIMEFSRFCGDRTHREIDASAIENFLRPFSLRVVAGRYGSLFGFPLPRP
ncbi:MAG: glycosyltransferase [Burkholderiales bacterium]|nr:glycosyltransferase [Burkholderiales bacterium]